MIFDQFERNHLGAGGRPWAYDQPPITLLLMLLDIVKSASHGDGDDGVNLGNIRIIRIIRITKLMRLLKAACSLKNSDPSGE